MYQIALSSPLPRGGGHLSSAAPCNFLLCLSSPGGKGGRRHWSYLITWQCTCGQVTRECLHLLPPPRYSSNGSYLGSLPDLLGARSSHGCAAFTNSTGTVSIPLHHPPLFHLPPVLPSVRQADNRDPGSRRQFLGGSLSTTQETGQPGLWVPVGRHGHMCRGKRTRSFSIQR